MAFDLDQRQTYLIKFQKLDTHHRNNLETQKEKHEFSWEISFMEIEAFFSTFVNLASQKSFLNLFVVCLFVFPAYT